MGQPTIHGPVFPARRIGNTSGRAGSRSGTDDVAAGVVGLIAATTVDLAFVTAARVPSLAVAVSIFVAALAFLYAWKNKLNVVVVILAAGLTGWLVFASQA